MDSIDIAELWVVVVEDAILLVVPLFAVAMVCCDFVVPLGVAVDDFF